MEKTASSSVKKRALSTSQMALIGVMTAVTCILGPFCNPDSHQPGADFFYESGSLPDGVCAGNEGRNDKLSYLSAPWICRTSRIFRLYRRCGKAGGANGRLSGWIYFYGSHSGLVH